MIQCVPHPESAAMEISGAVPNGTAVVSRLRPGIPAWTLRGGSLTVTTGGIYLNDTEAPIGVPLQYEARITGISTPDRLIQQNLMLTPAFNLGLFGWAAGDNRTLTTGADATAHTAAAVAHASPNASGTAPAAPPALIGHVDSAFGISGSYTLTIPTTGGTAIATNDWMLLIHAQDSTLAFPATPAGWTLISNVGTGSGMRRMVWKKKRAADTSVTVAAPSGANAHGTVLWVRNAIDEILVTTPQGTSANQDTAGIVTTQLTGQQVSVIRPNLVITTALETHTESITAPAAGSVTDGTYQYSIVSGTTGATTVVATQSNTNAGDIAATTVTYPGPLDGGTIVQVAFQVTSDLAARVIAKGKAAALTGPVTEPYLFTGRVRYVTAGLLSWADVKTIGTWQQVKTAKTTWLGVRGSDSAVTGDFAKLFLTIVNPADGTDYIPPVQIMGMTETRANTWIDFSAYISPAATIPTTAEIRLVHGAADKEYDIDWYLDEFGITPGSQRAAHSTLYWFNGASTVPAIAASFMLGEGWTATTTDAAISWTGTAGNSTSQFLGPSGVRAVTSCQLDPPDEESLPCEPMFLSDPVNAGFGIWVGLINLADPTHPGTRALYRAMNRAPAVAVSQARAWEDSQLTVMTSTLTEREDMLQVLSTGRILLMRNPEPLYPENNWYISIPDVQEQRIFTDQRRPERLWALPYSRVERPTGLIEASTAQTWQQVKDLGTWGAILTARGSWLNVLTGDDA